MSQNESNRSITRVGTFVGTHNIPKLDAICGKYNVAKGALLEVLILGIPSDQIGAYIATGQALRDATKVDRRKGRFDAMAKLRKLPADQLDALLAQAGMK